MAAFLNTEVKSTTLENALLEIAQMLQNAEQAYDPPAGTAQPNRVQIAINTDTKLVFISANLSCIPTISATGAISFTADEYL